jgi:hypothetical protein
LNETELRAEEVRAAIKSGVPFGTRLWTERVASTLQLKSSSRPDGRPRTK